MEKSVEDKFSYVENILEKYADSEAYVSLTIEENIGKSYLAEGGEITDIENYIEKGARVRMILPDSFSGEIWEIYGITRNVSEKGLENLVEYAKKAIESSNNISSLSRIFEEAYSYGIALSLPHEIYKFTPPEAKEEIYKFPVKKEFKDVSEDEKIKLVETMSKSAMIDGISSSTAFYQENIKTIYFADNIGSKITQIIPRPSAMIKATATAEDPEYGTVSYEMFDSFGFGDGGYELIEKALKEKSAEQRGKEVAEKAIKFVNASRLDSDVMTVVMDGNMAGVLIHEALGHMTEADHLVKYDMRLLKNKTGKKIASDKLTVIDDGRPLTDEPYIGNGRGSYKYDDEGTEAQKTVLVENGVLKNYLTSITEADILNEKQKQKVMRELGIDKEIDRLETMAEEKIKDYVKSYMKEHGYDKNISDDELNDFIEKHQNDADFSEGLQRVIYTTQIDMMGKIQEFEKKIEEAYEKQGIKEFKSTGNARAESWRAIPQVRMRNTYIKPLEDGPSLEDMVKDIDSGIYAEGSLGGYVIDGEFAFWPKEAYMIEDGKIRWDKPIKGLVLKGHTLISLNNITEIGNDTTYKRSGGNCGKGGQWVPVETSGPAVKIENMIVQGTPFDSVGHNSYSEAVKKEILSHDGIYMGFDIPEHKTKIAIDELRKENRL